MTVVKRANLAEVLGLIETHQPGAFYSVDDLQSSSDGIFPTAKQRPGVVPLPLAKMMRVMLNGAR